MSTIVTRTGKGSPLTWVEADANFTNLNADKLEAGFPANNVANTPLGDIIATNVQEAINELSVEKVAFTRLDDSDGSSLVGFLQSGTGAVPRTAQDKMREPVSVLDFYANGVSGPAVDPTGAIDSTAGIQLAINRRNVFIPDGTYLVDTLYFPNSPSDAVPNGGKFVGSPNVIFLQRTPNTFLFRKEMAVGRLYNWEIGPFCVKPYAGASSTLAAIEVAGLTGCVFNDIRGMSNGSAGFYAIFDISANILRMSYFNTYNSTKLIGTEGYTKCFHFHNIGEGNISNSNANTINNPVIYNNRNLQYGIDAHLTYGTTVNAPWIEANENATAIVMGPSMVINGGAMETNLLEFNYSGALNTPSNTTVIGTYLGSAHDVDFGAHASYGNLWINVKEAAGACNWINQNGVGNQKVQPVFTANPGYPTVTQTGGTAGGLFFSAFNLAYPFSQMSRLAKYSAQTQFNPADLSNVALSFNPGAGWNIAGMSVSVTNAITGALAKSAMTGPTTVVFEPTGVNPHFINVWIDVTK